MKSLFRGGDAHEERDVRIDARGNAAGLLLISRPTYGGKERMMRKIQLCLLVLTAVFATGCPKSKPNVPDVLAKRVALYEISRFDYDAAAYDQAVSNNQPEPARRLRNRVVDRLKANIDANYHEFENQLFTGRATTNVLSDITELGAAAAINITNGERAKNIIAVLLTGFKGGRKSIDENFFKERTTAAIISQMQASRAHIETGILTNMNEKDASEYSLDAALGDLINYFYAGTLQKGLQDLAQQAGQSAIDEKKNAQAAREKGRLGVTKKEADIATDNRTLYLQLRKDALTQPIDPQKQTAALARARFALKQLTNQEPDPDLKPSELFDALGQAMRDLDRREPGEATTVKISNALQGKQ